MWERVGSEDIQGRGGLGEDLGEELGEDLE